MYDIPNLYPVTFTRDTKQYSLKKSNLSLKQNYRFLKILKVLFGGQGQVVQSMVSLTSSSRGQLVRCFTTLLPNTLIFFVGKMREAFALQKLLTFFQQKILDFFRY